MSIAYAPILMVQQTMAVIAALTGRKFDWTPQSRAGSGQAWSTVLRFHLFETVLGVLLLTGMITGYISLWLIPIMASLILAAPLSRLSGMALPGTMATPQEVRAPLVAKRADQWRAMLRAHLAATPAE